MAKNEEIVNVQKAFSKNYLPLELLMLNDKLSNSLPNGGLPIKYKDTLSNDAVINLEISKQGAKKPIITPVLLYYDDERVKLNTGKPWTPYDRAVHDACATLYEAGYEYFTADMVYRAMNGLTDKEKVSPQARGAVTKSLDKAMSIRLFINYTNVPSTYKRGKNTEIIVDSQLLAADRLRAKAGGYEVTVYKFLRKPLLYEYNQMTGQILKIPNELLKTKSIKSTEDVIIIKSYLLRHIEAIRKNRRNNHIRYNAIYEELGIEDPEDRAFKDRLYRIRSNIKKLLNEWTEKDYIKGYEEYDKRGSKGVIIRVMDELE